MRGQEKEIGPSGGDNRMDYFWKVPREKIDGGFS
jgi:hypothetical protein